MTPAFLQKGTVTIRQLDSSSRQHPSTHLQAQLPAVCRHQRGTSVLWTVAFLSGFRQANSVDAAIGVCTNRSHSRWISWLSSSRCWWCSSGCGSSGWSSIACDVVCVALTAVTFYTHCVLQQKVLMVRVAWTIISAAVSGLSDGTSSYIAQQMSNNQCSPLL
jgi:hypothetical protein